MANYILFDDFTHFQLLPLTFTRPIADLRIGILTIREKWEQYLGTSCAILTVPYLEKLFPVKWSEEEENVWINAKVLPNRGLAKQIRELSNEEAIVDGRTFIALKSNSVSKKNKIHQNIFNESTLLIESHLIQPPMVAYSKLEHTWDLFLYNGQEIEADFELLTENRVSESLEENNTLIDSSRIFIEEGANVQGTFLNASKGPIYIGKNATVMEGSLIRGPFALCDNGVVKMGTRIYGGTTIGPYAKVGGEISNSVIWGYSNKGHDGYLGNSVLGAWCNLGADTNSSNLKNNYSKVKVWNYAEEDFVDSEQQFCGLIMGDHSKSGINSMFNTGTVVGVAANVFGSDFPPKFIPSFSWGGGSKWTTHKIEKAVDTASRMYARRNLQFSKLEEEVLKAIFEQTAFLRKNESSD